MKFQEVRVPYLLEIVWHCLYNVQKYGQIDILVSNAAANPSVDPIVTISEKALDKLWEVNVKASVQIVQVQ